MSQDTIKGAMTHARRAGHMPSRSRGTIRKRYSGSEWCPEAGCQITSNTLAKSTSYNDLTLVVCTSVMYRFRHANGFRCGPCVAQPLRRCAELGEIDRSIDFREMAEFILITMWGSKAAIRHAGSTSAAKPVSRMLIQNLGGLRVSSPSTSRPRRQLAKSV